MISLCAILSDWAQGRQECCQIRWKSAFEVKTLTCDRMPKSKRNGMKCLSLEGFDFIATLRAIWQLPATTVYRVADQRMSNMCRMDAYLMRASCFKPTFDKRCVVSECFNDLESCYSVASILKHNGLSLPVCFVTGKHCGDLYDRSRFEADPSNPLQAWFANIRNAITYGLIPPLDSMFFELLRKPVMGNVRFRDDKQPAGILVDPMHDSGPLFTSNSRQLAAEMVQ